VPESNGDLPWGGGSGVLPSWVYRGEVTSVRILTIRESAWLNSSSGRVWEKLETVDLWPSWHGGINDVHWRGRIGLRPGHRFLLTGPGANAPYLRGGRVIAVDGGRSFFWSAGIGPARAQLGLTLDEDGCGTLVQFHAEFRGWATRWVATETRVNQLRLFQRSFLQMLRESVERVGSPG